MRKTFKLGHVFAIYLWFLVPFMTFCRWDFHLVSFIWHEFFFKYFLCSLYHFSSSPSGIPITLFDIFPQVTGHLFFSFVFLLCFHMFYPYAFELFFSRSCRMCYLFQFSVFHFRYSIFISRNLFGSFYVFYFSHHHVLFFIIFLKIWSISIMLLILSIISCSVLLVGFLSWLWFIFSSFIECLVILDQMLSIVSIPLLR